MIFHREEFQWKTAMYLPCWTLTPYQTDRRTVLCRFAEVVHATRLRIQSRLTKIPSFAYYIQVLWIEDSFFYDLKTFFFTGAGGMMNNASR